MRRIVFALVFMALPFGASAEPSEEARRLADLLIDRITGRDPAFPHSSYDDEEPTRQLTRMPGAVEAILQESVRWAISPKDLDELSRYIRPLLKSRPIEAIEPLRKMLASPRTCEVEFALRSIEDADLVPDMVDDLIPVMSRRDPAGGLAANLFTGCHDAVVVKKLAKAGAGSGFLSERALFALSLTQDPEIVSFMQSVASDRRASSSRRVTAMSSLDAATPEGQKILREALDEDDEFIRLSAAGVLAAVGPALHSSETLGTVLDAIGKEETLAEARVAAIFHDWTHADAGERRRLFEACLKRVVSPDSNPGLRKSCLALMDRLTGQGFGAGADAAEKWAWWWQTHGPAAFQDGK